METIYVLRENDSIVSATRDEREAIAWRGEVKSPNGGMSIYRNYRETQLLSKRERAEKAIRELFAKLPTAALNAAAVAANVQHDVVTCTLVLSSLQSKGLLTKIKFGGEALYQTPQGPGL